MIHTVQVGGSKHQNQIHAVLKLEDVDCLAKENRRTTEDGHQAGSVSPTGMGSCFCMWFVTFHLSLRLWIHTVLRTSSSLSPHGSRLGPIYKRVLFSFLDIIHHQLVRFRHALLPIHSHSDGPCLLMCHCARYQLSGQQWL